jgi:hypothetical protein
MTFRSMLAVAAVLGACTLQARARPAPSTPPPVYVQECGGCHVPYPARGLAAADWRRVLDRLDRHFGSDAALDAATVAQIGTWLDANAGRGPAQASADLPRVTTASWFVREHDEVPARAWRSPEVQRASNCAACHAGAAEGIFSEHSVRVPDAARASPSGHLGDRR